MRYHPLYASEAGHAGQRHRRIPPAVPEDADLPHPAGGPGPARRPAVWKFPEKRQQNADLQARALAGAQLARNPRIDVSAVARRQLRAGRVDARILVILPLLAATSPVSVLAFGDSGPGAGAASPLRSVELARSSETAGAGHPRSVRAMVALLKAQQAPFRPARIAQVRLADGRAVVPVEFTAPSPLGLLESSSHAGS
jgi:hypothetical protein